MVLTMLWCNVILTPSSPNYAYKWEIVGFRAAWVSVTQIPLVYCLSCKFNVISLITGISYERMNWLHRWVSRTVFLTVICHWSFFFREWVLADFVQLEMGMMPMVKYGFGAWAVIGWMVITGFGFARSLCYELWVLQHLAGAGTLLWLLFKHVPAYARYNIWLAIAFVALDRGVRLLSSLARNLHLRRILTRTKLSSTGFGFAAHAEALPHSYVKLTIDNPDFVWSAGQHVFVCIPKYGLLEFHPFTIATEAPSATQRRPRHLEIYLKAHSGFTRRVMKRCKSGEQRALRTYLSGPWGCPPLQRVEMADSVIFLASSTGASFTVPLLLHLVRVMHHTRHVCFYWIIRHPSQLCWFEGQVLDVLHFAEGKGVKVHCRIFVTGACHVDDKGHSHGGAYALQAPEKRLSQGGSTEEVEEPSMTGGDNETPHPNSKKEGFQETSLALDGSTTNSSISSIPGFNRRKTPVPTPSGLPQFTSSGSLPIDYCRPASLDSLIRPSVEDAEGETAIVACGGRHLMAQLRSYVASLSDERAVHKGTGAQGIYLFTETYGW